MHPRMPRRGIFPRVVTHGPITTEPTCPRCGYDQSGAVTSWTECCPVEGTCPECGIRFAWADLFDPSRLDIVWFVEHARTVTGQARRTGPTLWRIVLPWVFWARVGVRARTDPRAALRWLLLVAIAVHLACWGPFTLAFVALENGYSLAYADLVAMLRSLPPARLAAGAVTGFFWPLAWMSGSLDLYWGGAYYDGGSLLVAVRFPVGMGLTWLAVLSLLPVTRRLARLRRAHLLRAVLFQLVVVVVVFSAMRLLYPIAALAASGVWIGFALAALFLGVSGWSVIWWVCAVRIGWRIRSWTLLILGTVAAVLGGVALSVVEMAVSGLARML